MAKPEKHGRETNRVCYSRSVPLIRDSSANGKYDSGTGKQLHAFGRRTATLSFMSHADVSQSLAQKESVHR